MPGGMRRFSRAAARGTMAAVDPSTGGQSMPRMVTAGRAHSMSLTLPSAQKRHAVEHASVAAELLRRIELTRPGLRVVQPGDRGVALVVPKCCQHRDERGERIGCRAAEHPGVHFGLECLNRHHDVDHAAQAHRGRRVADGRVAGVADEDRIRTQQVCVLRHEVLQATGALLLRPLDDQLQVDRYVVTQSAQSQ